jgi:glycosyltransferase involved in cell wall biosynthesis
VVNKGVKTVRIAIFNDHWHTFGGGEQSALQIAVALQNDHEVFLLATQPVSIKDLESHCQRDLSRIQLVEIDKDRHSIECTSSEYDVFINHSHQSTVRNFAKHGIYQVMFPQRIDRSLSRDDSRLLSSLIDRLYGFRLELQGTDCFVSDGDAWFSLNPSRNLSSVSLSVASPTWSELTVRVFDTTKGYFVSETPFILPIREVKSIEIGDPPPSCIVMIQNHHVDTSDRSKVPFKLHAITDSSGMTHTPTELSKNLRRDPEDPKDYLKSYRSFIANSEYTKLWTEKYLNRQSMVVYPPVVPSSSHSTCKKQILSIGRFFGGEGIHSKNQVQMVQAFKNLPKDLLDSWRLVLIGGTSREHRAYAADVRKQSINYPVDIYFNASRELVIEHLQSASIYWHLAGFGQDLEVHPESAEHFGIAIVEAMSAGIIPLAFNAGGPKEILSRFPDLLFNSLDELVEKTVTYSQSNSRTAELRRELLTESKLFDVEHYQSAWRELIINLH